MHASLISDVFVLAVAKHVGLLAVLIRLSIPHSAASADLDSRAGAHSSISGVGGGSRTQLHLGSLFLLRSA